MTVGPFRRNLPRMSAVNSVVRSVLIVIMRSGMKKVLPVLLLSLGACGLIPSTDNGDGGQPPPIAQAGQPTQSRQLQNLKNQNVGDAPASDTPAAGSSAAKSVTFDSSKKFELADVYVSTGDPTGMRALVPYLMKPEV